MSESAYLKDELGPVLAKGLAAVSIAKPSDPVEYLGLWLLHHLQQKERKAQEVEAARQLESERESWAKGRAAREKAATAIIQREWKAHVHAQKDAERKESALRKKFAEIENDMEDLIPEEGLPDGVERNDQERDAETARMSAEVNFKRMRLLVAELDKSSIADFKYINANNKSATMVLKCCFYLQGARPKQVETWEKIRAQIKPYPFASWLEQFQPCGNPLERKRKLTRVRRLLTLVAADEVEKAGPALHAVYRWVSAAAEYREMRDEHIRTKRAAGRDIEEEYEEEEENEEEEKDNEEEVIKARELEEQRQREAEAAAEAGEEEEA